MRVIKVRSDFAYHIQNDYIDWSTFDNISPFYFSCDTVKFFRSKRYAVPVWSESEQGFCFVVSNKAPLNHRTYSVAKMNLSGRVQKIDTFKTLAQAEKYLSKLIKEGSNA